MIKSFQPRPNSLGCYFRNFFERPDSINQYDAPADLFIVGDEINRAKLRNFLGSLEAEINTEIKFTLMDKEEFDYRYSMFGPPSASFLKVLTKKDC